jgi:hypothetical protein
MEKRKKKTVVEIAVLALLILGFAIAGRIAGEQSLLPWSW